MANGMQACGSTRPVGRYGGVEISAARQRHTLYMLVRSHLNAEADGFPEELTPATLGAVATMAKGRRDARMSALCRRARQVFSSLEGLS